jgi:hypothetical protein
MGSRTLPLLLSGTGSTPLREFTGDTFPTGSTPAGLFIPGVPTGGHYLVVVTCDRGGYFSFTEKY